VREGRKQETRMRLPDAAHLIVVARRLALGLVVVSWLSVQAMGNLVEGAIAAAPSASFLSAGGTHTCAFTASGSLACWGRNVYRQLGDGTTTDRFTPVGVAGLASGAVAVAAGETQTCALTSAGGIKCWGYNFYGQVGDGTNTNRSTPVDVAGMITGATLVATGDYHTCAVTAAGGAKCWGDNAFGNLGDGTETKRNTPTDVAGLTSGVVAVTAGRYHSCALTSIGGVKCWGYNSYGELGDGTTTNRDTAGAVSGLTGPATAVSAGSYHTCALSTAGGVKCWGANSGGQLGDGTTGDRSTPVDVVGLTTGVTMIAVGASHTCALTTTGGVRCWGFNSNGQVGDGTTSSRSAPVTVPGLVDPRVIASGAEHTCAVSARGGVKCWGFNFYGEVGDSTRVNALTPVAVVGFAAPPGTLPVLDFATRPVRAAAGFAFGFQPVVTLSESSGAVRGGDNSTVITIDIMPGRGAPGAVLSCAQASVKASDGRASFDSCTIDAPGEGYVLRARASDGEAVAISAPFNVTLAGDVDGDCHVGITDFSLVVTHFGKTSASPAWTSPAILAFRADLNGDSRVSILDFSIVVARFGTAVAICPSPIN